MNVVGQPARAVTWARGAGRGMLGVHGLRLNALAPRLIVHRLRLGELASRLGVHGFRLSALASWLGALRFGLGAYGLGLVALLAVVPLLVSPVGEFPVDDDWSYAQ